MSVAGESAPAWRRLWWRWLGRVLFRMTYHNWYRTRRLLIRLGGARITPTTKFRATVRIDRPWNLSAGELTVFGFDVVLNARAPITIGDRCVISQYATVTTEVRDHRTAGHPRRVEPIAIEDDCWVATDTLVLPGARIRRGTVVGARSMVEGELPPWSIAVGEPAVRRGERVLRPAAGGPNVERTESSADE